MRIEGVGAGPGALYFAILMKQAFPDAEITLHERNRPDDTFGWGVVFSEETLDHFETADPASYGEIVRRFAYWSDIDTWHRGTWVRSTGHGFCGMSRVGLLQILHRRCEDLGVRLVFRREIEDVEALRDADLVLGADGVNSGVREAYADRFEPTIGWGRCKFTWLGTTLPLEAFTFVFRESEHGLFQVHAYPFERDLSTFIVECHEDVWRRAGLDEATEEDTVRFCESLFAEHLRGHRLLTNKSVWRSFPTIRCGRWHHENVVLLGDAVHTAHFSIGSGTKLAMEDAITLVDAFRVHGPDDVSAALAAYEEARRLPVLKLQRAARTSRLWFEQSARYVDQPPVRFVFNLMTRSKRITYDNLRRRDPALVRDVAALHAETAGVSSFDRDAPPAPMFTPFSVRGLTLANRVAVSAMCQYSAVDGRPTDWHLVHLGAMAVGGASLVFTEMTDVEPAGCITRACTGLWNDEHEAAWRRIVDFVHGETEAKIGIQLGHAGRKGSCTLPWEGDAPIAGEGAWATLGPSALPYAEGWPAPQAMDRTAMDGVRDAFVQATRRAARAGFDVLELHTAHGYLLSSFLSPLANQRDDAYGGSLENRMRYPLEVFEAVRAAWPEDRPVFVRVTATDWLDAAGGQTIEDAVAFARALFAAGCDVVDVSSGGNSPRSEPEYGRMYQVPFADRIRHEVGVPVMAVGGILGADHVNTVVAAGRADLCALARPHLINPHLTMEAAGRYGDAAFAWPRQYLPARPAVRDEEAPAEALARAARGERGPRIRHARRAGDAG